MKQGLTAVAIVLVAAAALYFFVHRPETLPPATGAPASEIAPTTGSNENPSAAPNPQQSPPAIPAPGENVSSNLADRAGVVTPPTTNAPTLSAGVVVLSVSHAIHDYSAVFGGNPVGTNPEITSALNGNNPKHLNFIRPEAGLTINGNGELVDPWGTPLFFHQLSAKDTEVRSAGKDKMMWTEDDIISH